MKNKTSILFIIIMLPLFSLSQMRHDTLTANNLSLKAAKMKDSLNSWLNLNNSQSDSVLSQFTDYFNAVIKTKMDGTITKSQRMKLIDLYKREREIRLKKILTATQYITLLKKRNLMEQRMSQKIDSIRIKH